MGFSQEKPYRQSVQRPALSTLLFPQQILSRDAQPLDTSQLIAITSMKFSKSPLKPSVLVAITISCLSEFHMSVVHSVLPFGCSESSAEKYHWVACCSRVTGEGEKVFSIHFLYTMYNFVYLSRPPPWPPTHLFSNLKTSKLLPGLLMKVFLSLDRSGWPFLHFFNFAILFLRGVNLSICIAAL